MDKLLDKQIEQDYEKRYSLKEITDSLEEIINEINPIIDELECLVSKEDFKFNYGYQYIHISEAIEYLRNAKKESLNEIRFLESEE